MNRTIAIVVAILLIATTITSVSAVNITGERTYFAEETAIPFEVFVLLLGVGMVFMILAAITAFTGASGGITMVFGLISFGFLTGTAFASPTTGFYSYITNTTTNATSTVTPVVWLIMQPWMMWLLWGMASISFLLFVMGILNLFKEQKDAKDMYWI
jgi:hypothetical protein